MPSCAGRRSGFSSHKSAALAASPTGTAFSSQCCASDAATFTASSSVLSGGWPACDRRSISSSAHACADTPMSNSLTISRFIRAV